MSFTSGTGIVNQNAMLETLRAWLVGTVGWTELDYTEADREAISAANVAAGTLYTALDVLTISGGTFTTAAQIRVDTVDGGGAILTFTLITPGQYSVLPSNPVSVTGGTGSGATFNMTWNHIATEVSSLSLQGDGAGAGKRVFINIETHNNLGSQFYGWRMFYATSYQSGIAFGSQQGAGGPVYFNLWQNTMNYWFQANDRHFKVEVLASTNVLSCYAGFGLPIGLPSEYPFPLVIIGNYYEEARADLGRAANSSIADPGKPTSGVAGCAFYRRRTSETNTRIENQDDSTAATDPSAGERAFIWPHKTGRGTGTFTDDPDYWNSAGFARMVPNGNNEAPLIDCHIIDLEDQTIVMALDGVFSTTGFGRTTGQTVTVGGRTFRLFQRPVQNGPGDFFAVEEV